MSIIFTIIIILILISLLFVFYGSRKKENYNSPSVIQPPEYLTCGVNVDKTDMWITDNKNSQSSIFPQPPTYTYKYTQIFKFNTDINKYELHNSSFHFPTPSYNPGTFSFPPAINTILDQNGYLWIFGMESHTHPNIFPDVVPGIRITKKQNYKFNFNTNKYEKYG